MKSTTMMLVAVLMMAGGVRAAEQRAQLKVTADAGITSIRAKMNFSNGRGPATPIMQNQNWSGFESKTLLMAFDTAAIRGWTVSRANLHIYVARGDLYGLGLCTILAEWAEGRALNGVEAEGAPCWNYRAAPARGAKGTAANHWAWPGSKFYSVSWVHPAARYSNAGPGQIKREKTPDGRFLHLTVPVKPKLVESLAAGVATGLVLTDDKGQVRESYSLIGAAYPYRYNASEEAWVFTRDIHKKGYRPMLEVFGEAVDKTPPARPKGAKVAEVHPTDGSVVVTFTAPGDDGTTGQVLAYEAVHSDARVTEANWSKATALPKWAMPKAVGSGKTQRMPVFTLAGGKYHLGIRAVDEAGNRGGVADLTITIPRPPDASLAAAKPERLPGGQAPARQDVGISIVPDTVKVDPVSGMILLDGTRFRPGKGYLQANRIWRADSRTARLTAAANEVAACQVILGPIGKDGLTGVRVSVSDLAGPAGRKIAAGPNVQTFRVWYVPTVTEKRRAAGPGGMDATQTVASGWQGDACL
ncbi:hypothetical protein LCGC14_1852610, partial [marine sediment metagenome]